MRKKFLAMYALVGALVASPIFTSCIDSEESASVTQVRSERAAQIKAAAEMQKAMDELNLAIKQIDLEENQLDLEKKKAEVERDILSAKLSILQNQAALDKYQDGLLSTLTNRYTQALSNIADYNKQIFNKTAEIAQLERKQITAAAYIAKEKIAINNDIAAYEATLELLKNTEATDKDDLAAQLEVLAAKLEAARDAVDKLNSQYGDIRLYVDRSDLTTYITMDVKDNSGNQLYWQLDGQQGTSATATDDNGTSDPSDDITIDLPKVTAYVLDGDGNKIINNYGVDQVYEDYPTKVAAIEAARELHLLEINATNFVNGNGESMSFFTYDADGYLMLKEEAVEVYKQDHAVNAEEQIKNLKVELGTEADTETTETEEGSGTLTLYAELAKANKALAEAEKALAENEDDSQTATLEGNVNAEKLNVAVAKDRINTKLNEIAQWEKTEDFEDYLAAFNEGYADYKAAKDALDAADEEWKSLDAEWEAINELKGNLEGQGAEALAESIAEYEAKIVHAKQTLEDLNKSAMIGGEYDGNLSNSYDYSAQEAAIAYAKEQLEILKVKLASEEVIAEEAKAALDAYLATEEAA